MNKVNNVGRLEVPTTVDVHTVRHAPAQIVTVTRVVHKTLWVLLLLLYALNATILLMLASLYATSTTPNAFMNLLVNFLEESSWRYLVKNHVVIAATFATLGMLFVYPPTAMVWLSLRQRRLIFQAEPASPRRHHHPRYPRLMQRIRTAMHSVHVLGVHFPRFLFVVELVEIAVQTAQGYRSSIRVGSTSLNLMYGILTCVNCCSTPIVLYIWETRKRQELLGRLVCVVVDSLLDVVWGAAFQGYIMIRSFRQIKGSLENLEEYMGDVLEQVLVVSTINFAFSVVPFMTSLWVLTELREALGSAHVVASGIQPSVMTSAKQKKPPNAKSTAFALKTLHIALGVYGVAILSLSLVSIGMFSPAPKLDARCAGILFPWGHGPTCVIHYINCTERQIMGRAEEITPVFEEMVPSLARNISISECPEWEMPTDLGPFTNLEYLYMRDSTIVAWSSDAALAVLAPKLSALVLTSIYLESAPDGLVSIPKTVTDIGLDDVVDAELLLDIAIGDWNRITSFLCTQCNLTSVPRAVIEMSSVVTLVLDDNLIEFLPEDGLGSKNALMFLSLSGNPINNLPGSLWMHLPAMMSLSMDNTNISNVPRLDPIVGGQSPTVFACSTPLCEDETIRDVAWPTVMCSYD